MSVMRKRYDHLSYKERVALRAWKIDGISIREMARRLGRSASTISREMRRNSYSPPGSPHKVNYFPDNAEIKARKRRARRYRLHKRKLLKDSATRKYVEQKLRLRWSPEQIAGRMKRCKRRVTVSHEAIYQWLYKERRDLLDCLVRNHKHRHVWGQRKTWHWEPSFYQDYSIDGRPKCVTHRKQFGHWEADSMQSPRKDAALHVAVERKTRFVSLSKLQRNTADEVKFALVKGMRRLPAKARKSFTYDRGRENTKHLEINKALGSRSYFCDPLAAWQKGTVENTIGVIRRTFPRGTQINRLSSSSIEELERRLNHKPRKCLQFETPMEAFMREIVALQL